ncbi:MAG TPA: hypothetical protein IAB63_06015 [Candidatus Onthocola gallistercoris]|uniref:Uncharacterized protein n=1 Tax=Candidatus Onthocola gallistercoris TaxID=2840876 RepID=A0A9D1KWW2_9FIRM|nr:hypothetical protein [Candidatus Onthocola gallistercoris]
MKRILALIGAILLIGMYAATLIFALMSSSLAFDMFRASVLLTIAVPFLLFAYTLIYKYLKSKK